MLVFHTFCAEHPRSKSTKKTAAKVSLSNQTTQGLFLHCHHQIACHTHGLEPREAFGNKTKWTAILALLSKDKCIHQNQ